MKKIAVIVALIVLCCILSIAIFIINDLMSKPTKEMSQEFKISTDTFKNRKIYTMWPQQDSNKTILYLHGGAYMGEITKEHWNFLGKLIKDTGAKIIVPDYPLAPKYSYEDVFNMVEPLYEKTINEVGKENLILMGDSAGGGLATALLEKIKDNIEVPYKTILISPWLDVSMSNEKMSEIQPYDKELNVEKLKIAGATYAREQNCKNYLVSPIYGDMTKLKNIVIFTGTYDILNPDAIELEKKVEEVGGNLELKQYEKASHIWIVNKNCDSELVDKGYNDLVKEII